MPEGVLPGDQYQVRIGRVQRPRHPGAQVSRPGEPAEQAAVTRRVDVVDRPAEPLERAPPQRGMRVQAGVGRLQQEYGATACRGRHLAASSARGSWNWRS